jgi:hypothetical protein
LYHPGILRRIGRLFVEHPDWQMIYCDDTVWKQGWLVANRPQKQLGLPELLKAHIIPQASTFFRKSAYLAVGGFERERLKVAGDHQLWLRLAARYPIHFLPEHASTFRLRPSQLTNDWGRYMAEVYSAIGGAMAYVPRHYLWRTLPRVMWRRLKAARQLKRRRFFYPLAEERVNWPTAVEPPRQPMTTCRCPICDGYPQRLLFSTPDTRFGDRTIWRVYFCEKCQAAFRFPRPDKTWLQRIPPQVKEPQFVDLPDVPPGVYSPYKTVGLICNRALSGMFRKTRTSGSLRDKECAAHSAAGNAILLTDDRGLPEFPLPTEPRDSQILCVEALGSATAERLLAAGFSNVLAEEFDRVADNGRKVQAVVMNQTLQYSDGPVRLLAAMRGRLLAGGRVYISMPNLDSAFLAHYGPCWSQWGAPFHAITLGRSALAAVARRAGLGIETFSTTTPARWVLASEQLAVRGLFSHTLGDAGKCPDLYRDACAVARAAAWKNFRGRGDCLHATLRAIE